MSRLSVLAGSLLLTLSWIPALQAADTVPPATPGSPKAVTQSPRTVRVSWTKATDNVAVTGYNVYRNGAYLATTHKDSVGWTALWLTPSTQYNFAVSAIDAAKNESPLSAAVTATTNSELNNQLYVGGRDVDEQMIMITPACMTTLRTKRVLAVTKSIGLNLIEGYAELKAKNSPYWLVADEGSLSTPKIKRDDCTRYPFTRRVDELGNKIAAESNPIDAAFVLWGQIKGNSGDASQNYDYLYEYYCTKFAAMQVKYPKTKFIYATSGLTGEIIETGTDRENNLVGVRFNEMLRNKLQGMVPILDNTTLYSVKPTGDTLFMKVPYANYPGELQKELATYVFAHDRALRHDTSKCPLTPESGLHANLLYKTRLALGTTLMLAKVFCPDCFRETVGIGASANMPAAMENLVVNGSPAAGTFRLTAGNTARAVQLYAVSGAMVADLRVSNGMVNWKAACPQLASGMYFVGTTGSAARQKVILINK